MIETLLIVLPLMLSPGPANLASFGLSARYGFYQIRSFLLGVIFVYVLVATVLGSTTHELAEQFSKTGELIQLFGGFFILIIGAQLMRRKNWDVKIKAPSVWSGVLVQALNPKYPPVVLSVFASRPGQNSLVTVSVLTIVGVIGLVMYGAAGALIHHKLNKEKQFYKLDFIFGAMLCLVGLWLMSGPVNNYIFNYAK